LGGAANTAPGDTNPSDAPAGWIHLGPIYSTHYNNTMISFTY